MRMSRRRLLAGVLLGVGKLSEAVAETPPAPPKITQQEAQYQPTPKDGQRCAACTFFAQPAGCKVVQGVISPHGWCKLFDLPD